MSRLHIALRLLLLFLALVPVRSADAGLLDMLMVVANTASLTTQESYRKSGFELYGFTVTLIDDGASQASFDAAVVGKNVAYVPITVNATTLGAKLKTTTIGVVNEHPNLADDFGFSDTTNATGNKTFVAVQSVTHYITYGTSGNLTILTTARPLARRSGTLAAGAINLASVEGATAGVFNPGLLTLEVGAALQGGGTAAGRRVLLPVGDSTFDVTLLNTAGQLLFIKAIEWAARPNPAVGELLFVVTSTSAPTSQETKRRLLIDTWGYNVTLIDDDATQANFNTALVGKDVVYVSEEVAVASVSTKLTSTTLGVVNEDHSLSDEFGMSTTSAAVAATSITITDNTHYITSPFSTGALTVFTSSQEAATLTGTFALGLQTLATVGSAKSLAVIETGGALTSGQIAAGRRVQLPWGGANFDFNTVNSSATTLMRRAIEWAATPSGTPVLLVVANSASLSTQELARKTQLASWGYTVNVIDDDATQATFDTFVAGNRVVYIPEEIASGSLSTKLRSAAIGIVSEEAFLTDEFGISSSQGTGTGSSLTITNGTHYITSTLGAGSITIFSSSQAITNLSGTFASEMQVLGQWGSNRALVTIDAGAKLHDGSTAAGRRVQLPWGDTAFDFNTLNASGKTLMRRSIEWALGLVGFWRLDETSGSTATDSSAYRNNGTVAGGLSFATDSVNPGKLGRALQFDGSADYISINSAASLQPTTALTIAAWIKGDAWGSASYVNSILRKGDANPNNYQFAIADGKVQLSLDDNDDSGFRGNTTLQTGAWYHVAATWDGATVRIYVNGVLDRTPPQTQSSPIGVDTRALYLGGRTGSTDLFDGAIDDVRLYNYALDATEILTLKGHGQPKGIRVLRWVEVQ